MTMAMAMATASSKQPFHFLYAFVLAIFLLSCPVYSIGKDCHFIQDLNSYRKSANLPALTLNKNAKCIAEKIALDLAQDNEKCTDPNSTAIYKGPGLSLYPKYICKCIVSKRTVHDALVLPVCVPRLAKALVIASYTRTEFNSSIGSSNVTGIGIGSEKNWMVVVLSTNTQHGTIANGAARSLLHAKLGSSYYYMVLLLLGFVLICL